MFPFVLYKSVLMWGLPLLALPVLIHLINMMRHRRVRWAAMEFLAESQKKHRTWIMLKQLLLLALRVGAVAAIVFMLAQPVLRAQWAGLFGSGTTHHVILLDDSFSMSDRWGNTSAFDQARQVVKRLAGQSLRQRTGQYFTLLRFSRAARAGQSADLDLREEVVNESFPEALERRLARLRPSELAVGPQAALEAIERLKIREDENRVVYVLTDFRRRDWNNAQSLEKQLRRLERTGAELHLVQCVDQPRPNLAVTALASVGGTRVAGVPLFMEVAVTNFGTSPARQVSLQLKEDGRSIPPLVINEIPAGKTVARRFQALFATAGQHAVTATLEADAVAVDNVRYCVVDVLPEARLLIVDGDARAQDAFFLTSALAPGGNVETGLKPIVERPRYLQNHPLDAFEAVFLLNIEQLDQREVQALEAYARSGGGVCFFLGERSRAPFFNTQLHRDGQGLFPVPLAGPMELLVDRVEKTPDMQVSDHPIFGVFAGGRNSFLQTVNVQRYFATPKDWRPGDDPAVKVIARLRNGAPLAVERRFGEGTVIAFLTKASPSPTPQGRWNTWGADNPSYVITMLELQAYLAAGRHTQQAHSVGTPIRLAVTQKPTPRQIRFATPGEEPGSGVVVAVKKSPKGPLATLTQTDTSGFYHAELADSAGVNQQRSWALNVQPDEGDLATLDGQQLASRLKTVNYQFHRAQDLSYDAQQLAGFNLGKSLLFILLAILLLEQLVAYSASYHRAGLRRARR